MSGYGTPHSGPMGHGAPNQSGGGMTTCLIVGLIFGGLGSILAAFVGVAIVLFIRSDDGGSDSGPDYSHLSDDERAIQEALDNREAERERARLEQSRPPASIDEAVQDLKRGSDIRRTVCGRWIAQQSMRPNQRREVAEALETALLQANSEEAKLAVLQGLEVWGNSNQADAIAQVMQRSRTQDAVVQFSLELLEKYKQDSTIEEIASLLSSPDHGRQAAEVLELFGRDVIEPVLDGIDVGSDIAMTNARSLFASLGEDVNDRLLDLFLDRLNSADAHEQGQIANELSQLRVVPDRRDDVAAALDPMIDASNPYLEKVLRALKVWATDVNAANLIKLTNDSRYRRDESLIQIIVSLEDPAAIELLASLLDDAGSLGRLAVDALEHFGDPCKDAVLKYYNDDDERVRDRARRILKGCSLSDAELAEQCLDDLDSSTESIQVMAMETLVELEPVEDLQSEVAEKLVAITLEDDTWDTRRKPATAAPEVWATIAQATEIAKLVDHRDDEIWVPAFRMLLKMQAYEHIAFETAEKLGSFSDQERIADAMIAVGPIAEPLAIKMLEHNDKRAVEAMCKVLAEIGTQESLDPLRLIAEYAVQHNAPEITFAANLARDSIRERRRRSNSSDDDSDDDDG